MADSSKRRRRSSGGGGGGGGVDGWGYRVRTPTRPTRVKLKMKTNKLNITKAFPSWAA